MLRCADFHVAAIHRCFAGCVARIQGKTQLIHYAGGIQGLDPATGQLRAWTFDKDGSFGEGTWSHDGKKWTIDFEGVGLLFNPIENEK